ncbi:hypothetical protein HYH03_008327 [Edaphochlamys debaryana]|uniref:J domain-containing protein n=1 Tax=Edaphochlamys debaryana TaxID=47281 RepID=A0A836BY69_9CHLO|nr:hypothetical protein HYH03_008327 [Edaphochlamys debaryana]|eukprot:KAG2493511.1 hypothetical protein HYH03_008327 [Edaphochlamys debaryana]
MPPSEEPEAVAAPGSAEAGLDPGAERAAREHAREAGGSDVRGAAALRTQALGLLEEGRWGPAVEALEGCLFGGADRTGAPGPSVDRSGEGGDGAASNGEGAQAASQAPLLTAEERLRLLQLLVVARIHLEASGGSGAGHGAAGRTQHRTAAHSPGASVGPEDEPRASSPGQPAPVIVAVRVLRWAAFRLPARASAAAASGADPGVAPDTAAGSCTVVALSDAEVGRGARSWFRRLAALVHPDKCRKVVPEGLAMEAFRLLSEGCDTLAAEAERSGGARAHLKRRRGGSRSPDPYDMYGNVCVDEPYDDADEDAAWWGRWVDPWAGRAPPSTQPTAADEEPELWQLPLKELEAEVGARQAAVLAPPPGSAAAALGPAARQRRLRVARSVLSQRLEQESAARTARRGGGYL